jgi:S-adenosylmethionine synthetase
MARYLAKNIVASGIADKCEIQLAYAIGVARPVSIYLNTFNTEKVDKTLILETIKNNFDLSPNGIITYLDLLKPVYSKTSAYGHFGKENEGFTWENTNKIDLFKSLM